MDRSDWDPLRELSAVQRRMNRLFEGALARTDFETPGGFDRWVPQADVYETAESVVFDLELPGLRLDAIELRLDGEELVVEGERRMDHEGPGEHFHRVERAYGKFARRFPLPQGVDRGGIRATYRDGLLRVVLPMRAGSGAGQVRVPIG